MKSPLKDRPLRNAGESLEKYLHDYVIDGFMQYLTASGVFIILALKDWHAHLTDAPPLPRTFTVLALVSIGITIYQFRKTRKKVRAIRQGIEGERTVGQDLEALRENSAQVFHDIPAGDFNLDHVVIHPSGVYVIETKTYSRPDSGRAVITYDGESILVAGKSPSRNPVTQAKAAANWLKELLHESTRLDFPVRPVVLFPGWFIEVTAESKNSDVWVLNPKGLPRFIQNSRAQLSASDVGLLSTHLSRYVRTYQDKPRARKS